jgi:hypothetical protein
MQRITNDANKKAQQDKKGDGDKPAKTEGQT